MKHNGNGHGHVTETPDVSHIRNVDVTHEASDVYVRGIVTFLVALTVMTIAVYLLMWGMFAVLRSRENQKTGRLSPMAMSAQERIPPEPRLQAAPGFADQLAKEIEKKDEQGTVRRADQPRDALFEIRLLREHWQNQLQNGMKDESGKVIALPIAEAKKQLLANGLPTR